MTITPPLAQPKLLKLINRLYCLYNLLIVFLKLCRYHLFYLMLTVLITIYTISALGEADVDLSFFEATSATNVLTQFAILPISLEMS